MVVFLLNEKIQPRLDYRFSYTKSYLEAERRRKTGLQSVVSSDASHIFVYIGPPGYIIR